MGWFNDLVDSLLGSSSGTPTQLTDSDLAYFSSPDFNIENWLGQMGSGLTSGDISFFGPDFMAQWLGDSASGLTADDIAYFTNPNSNFDLNSWLSSQGIGNNSNFTDTISKLAKLIETGGDSPTAKLAEALLGRGISAYTGIQNMQDRETKQAIANAQVLDYKSQVATRAEQARQQALKEFNDWQQGGLKNYTDATKYMQDNSLLQNQLNNRGNYGDIFGGLMARDNPELAGTINNAFGGMKTNNATTSSQLQGYNQDISGLRDRFQLPEFINYGQNPTPEFYASAAPVSANTGGLNQMSQPANPYQMPNSTQPQPSASGWVNPWAPV